MHSVCCGQRTDSARASPKEKEVAPREGRGRRERVFHIRRPDTGILSP